MFQLEDSEARRLEAESVQKTLSAELDNAQMELENICKQKSLVRTRDQKTQCIYENSLIISVHLSLFLQVDEQLAQLRYERTDLMKRLEEDQEDLNELMQKHKALIAQVSM